MAEISLITDRTYDAHPRHRYDACFPDPAPAGVPLVCCLAGGWWHAGHAEDLRLPALALAAKGIPVAVLGHRRLKDIPGGDGGEMLGDVLAGVRKALEESLLHDHDGRHLALLGVGSGATLALLAAAKLAKDDGVNLHSAVGVDGLYDLAATDACDAEVRQQAAAFLGDDPAHRNPAALHRGLFPPVMLVHGEQDTAVPVKQAMGFRDHLAAAEIPACCTVVPQLGHGILDQPWRGPGASVIDSLAAWFSEDRHAEDDGPLVGEPEYLRK